jgi:hypothetical protein
MENKLISMTDYVFEKHNDMDSYTDYEDMGHLFESVLNYAKFLKQPLKLGMFVPCDKNGNVLKDVGLLPCYELDVYRKAKERVLFEGFKVTDRGNFYFIKNESSGLFYRLFKNNTKKNLESLMKVWSNIILTKSISEILGYEI